MSHYELAAPAQEDMTAVKVIATPDATSRFVGWSGDCSGTSSVCTLNVTEDMNATANFTTRGIRLSVSRPGTGQGTVTRLRLASRRRAPDARM